MAGNTSALTLANPWPGDTLATLGATAFGYPVRPPLVNMQSYNLTLEREIGRGAVLEAAFVGNKGTHLPTFSNINTPEELHAIERGPRA